MTTEPALPSTLPGTSTASAGPAPHDHSTMLRFFSHPMVGITGTVASVLSLALAIWFYTLSVRTPDLTALVHSVRTTVVKTGQASQLSVSFGDRVVDSDVTSVQIQLWNRGKLPIRPSAILKPVELVMPHTQILEATVKAQTRDIVNFQIDTTALREGRVPVKWDILEQNDGAVIQLIYAGNDTQPVDVQGIIEGQPSVSHATVKDPVSSVSRAGLRIILSLCGGWALGYLLACFPYPRPWRDSRRNRKLVISVVLLVMLAIGLFTTSFVGMTHPPFPF